MKIWQGWTIVIALSIPLSLGCQGEEKPLQASPNLPSKQVLRVEWRSQEAKRAFEPWAKLESGRTGIQLETAGEGQADILIGSPWDLITHAEQQQLVPIPPDLLLSRNPLRFDDFLPWTRQRTLVWDQKPLGIPLIGEGRVLLYRKDWLAEAAKKAGESKPPTLDTWEDLIRSVQLLAKSGYGATQGKPLASLGPKAQDWEQEFLWIHASHAGRAIGLEEKKENLNDNDLFGYLYDINSGDFSPGKKPTAESCKIWKSLAAFRAPLPPDSSPVKEFLAGKIGIGLFPLTACAGLQGSGLEDKVEVAPIPGARSYANSQGEMIPSVRPNRRPLLGGRMVLGMVKSTSQNQDLAWKFLSDLAMPMGETWALGKDTAGVTRTDQVLRMRWDRFDLDPRATLALRELLREQVLHAKVQNPAMYPRRPDSPNRSEVLKRILEALDSGLAPEEFATRWKAETDALGPTNPTEKRRIARLSAGLVP